MAEHEPLEKTFTIPTSAKARATALAWAQKWGVNQSKAMRAILRRGLVVAVPRTTLPAYPTDYEALCSFRVPAFVIALAESCYAKHPEWEHAAVLRTVFYLGLLEVAKDGLMEFQPRVKTVARNRERATVASENQQTLFS